MSSAATLVATDVHRIYKIGGHELPVLCGLNVQVAPGEKVFLCGQSGAGKTTLLRLLAGIERVQSGSMSLFSEDVRGMSLRQRQR